MHPSKVRRAHLQHFTDLPNIGKAGAADFALLGYSAPAQLLGVDPFHLYQALCRATGQRQDPCVLDVFMSVSDFLAGGAPRPWWDFTEERKRRYGQLAL
ncbi:helix-hairpin-helix domain-containing protein [Massilia sp. CF038]|uniref:helix-hairpin-helix domain-containing protein n=1 Tax=Massilia sp. CF038 TaxID=1881045 RepID=UPI0009176507|nr:helix-hairpin-helix domain-containing protein [Massilia sp. CF038]SHH41952.1 Pathogenicity locus [Massilia sp. CF038]